MSLQGGLLSHRTWKGYTSSEYAVILSAWGKSGGGIYSCFKRRSGKKALEDMRCTRGFIMHWYSGKRQLWCGARITLQRFVGIQCHARFCVHMTGYTLVQNVGRLWGLWICTTLIWNGDSYRFCDQNMVGPKVNGPEDEEVFHTDLAIRESL